MAQSIKGKVVDDALFPIPYASVALLQIPDSIIYKGSITDENGMYVFDKIKTGTYFLKVTTVGHKQAYISELTVDSLTQLTLPDLVLLVEPLLSEVYVSAIQHIVRFENGNIIVNVENSVLAKGNTVYDLLLKLPGISISNNTITLNGKSGVLIMLDERVQQLTDIQLTSMLKSMNAEVVEKIELLKNPPVKYEASGTGGMINIKTKKAKITGISGSVYSSYSQGIYARSMTGFTLNYKMNTFTLFSNLDYNHSIYNTIQYFDRVFTFDSATTELDGIMNYKDLEKNMILKTGADWQINKKTIVGVKVEGGPGIYIAQGNGTNTIRKDNKMGYDYLRSFTHTPDKWSSTNYNFNAEHRFDTAGTTLHFTTDYTRLTEIIAGSIENNFLNASGNLALPPITYKTNNSSLSSVFASKIDFSKNIGPTSSFDAGAKISSVRTSNKYLFQRKNNLSNVYYTDTALSNNFHYKEETMAAYANYRKVLTKISVQFGLRAEFTQQIGENTDKGFDLLKRYPNLFPNISMEYKASPTHNLQLNFNKRIDRPAFNDLNPFRWFMDQYYYFEGNPFLLPHYSYNAELTHGFKDWLTNSFTYTRTDQIMTDYTLQNDTTKVTTETKKNMKYMNYFAYALFIGHDVTTWWNASLQGLLTYIEYSGDLNDLLFHTRGVYYNISSTHTFLTSKSTKIELNAFYKSGLNAGLAFVNPFGIVSFAFTKTFLKNKWNLSIGINDLFYTMKMGSHLNFSNQNWTYQQTTDSRRLVITINYNFGKVNTNQREDSSNEEEKGRLKH